MMVVLITSTLSYKDYKPVIIFHGIIQSPLEIKTLRLFIEEAHPGTNVHTIDLFDYLESFQPLWHQVEVMRNAIAPIMKTAKNGVHVIGYSQGGMIARGIIQTTDYHNVNNFIALSSPLSGQYGDTYTLSWFFPHLLKEEMYKFFYTKYGQKWSVGNYWKDPHQYERYREFSDFLAHLNNEAKPDKTRFRSEWRTNFTKLKKLILIGGPDDRVITPWQSAQFGFYNQNETVLPMRHQEIYQKDTFGLRTLDRRQAVVTCTFSGVRHLHWPENRTVFEKCIAPFLD